MKKLIVSLFAAAFCQLLMAQNIFSGKVIDTKSRQPLEHAIVFSGDKNTITDQFGKFYIQLNKEEETIVQVSYIGYKSSTAILTKGKEINIELQQDHINLKEIILLAGTNGRKFATVSKIDLNLKPVRSTQELLRLVPGLFIAQHAGGGKAEQIFLRGFDSDHGTDVEVSVDGMPVNMVSHAHGQGYADAHFIIPETINNVDFGTGPYYAPHGNLNTAGYVSFTTFNSIGKSRVQLEAGQFNTFRGLAMIDLLKKNKDKQNAYVAGEFNYTDGPTENRQHFNRINVFSKYNITISDRTNFNASASLFKSKWDASGQVPERAVENGMINRFGSIDPSEGGNTERYNLNAVVSHKFHNQLSWDNQAYYSRYKFNLYSNFTFFLNDPVNGDGINQYEDRDMAGYASKLNSKNNFNGWTLNAAYAAGIRYDATHNSTLSRVVKRQLLNNIKLGDIKEINSYAYIDQQLNNNKWSFNAGLRIDNFNSSYHDKLNSTQIPFRNTTIISPKINVQYTVNTQLQVYAKAGKGFHSNDTRVVVENKGMGILPAAYGADLGMTLKPSGKMLLNIAAWYLYLQQEFVYVGDEAVIEASGRTRRIGVDVMGRYQFTDKLFANLNFNFTNARSIDDPKRMDRIPLAPELTSTGGLFYKARKGFNGGITYRYIKDRPANEDNSVIAKGYFLLDAVVNYTTAGYEIGIAIENMLDRKWNEAQFNTASRLMNEITPVSELHFTPGNPFFAKIKFAVFF